MLNIRVERTTTPKAKPAPGQKLGFGHIFTDHMFIMNYTEGQGWHDARIVPYQKIELDPSAMVFHYGQTMFEGLKAYRGANGEAYLFRPDMNAKRANNSNDRLCIPQIPEEDFVQAIKAVVAIDKDWIPTEPGTSLYIRPFIIATDEFLGVAPSKTYLFIVILSPSGAYYESGLAPVGIWIEDEYVRAVRGGIGFAKTGGNYAASLIAQVKAHDGGYSQVLWLDGVERKYIEEVGAMNIMFKIDGKIVTPMLNGSILPGITRNSVLFLCRQWGMQAGGGLRHRHRRRHQPRGQAALHGRGHDHRRRQHRPGDPEAVRHHHRHPDRQAGGRVRLARARGLTRTLPPFR